MKKFFLVLCTVFLFFQSTLAQFSLSETALAAVSEAPSLQISSIGGEWLVIGLARSGEDGFLPRYEEYYQAVIRAVKEKEGVLHARKNTEYARVVLALSALGENPRDVAGYDLLLPLLDSGKTISQGINGAIWALIALDSRDEFQTPDACQAYLDYILAQELPCGGFALLQGQADIDVTAMALCALARYREEESVSRVIERGLQVLSCAQTETGGYVTYGEETSETTAQVIIALSTLGISLEDPRFNKNGKDLMEHLLSYRTEDGGFAHTKGGKRNQMATEQALCALCAVARLQNKEAALYDLRDATPVLQKQSGAGLFGKHESVRAPKQIHGQKTFADIRGISEQNAIETLAKYGIIYGMSENAYCPNRTMTRAEFATILVRSLGLETIRDLPFADVSAGDWFSDSVSTAYGYGLVKGVSKTEFRPYGTITREEAAVMVARAAALCGMDVSLDAFTVSTVLSAFGDYRSVSNWAQSPMAVCFHAHILDESVWEIRPKEPINRAQVAQMLYQMLWGANLI